jgi:hypothetical protein
MKLSKLGATLCLGLWLGAPMSSAVALTDRVDEQPAMRWFELPPLDRTRIVREIAESADANFLDVFACITLFAKDQEHRSSPLANVLWLCSPLSR